MCGLVGMAGDLGFDHRNMMKDLLYFNTLRGKDSTGVTAFNMTKNEVVTRKATIPGYEFIQMPFIDGLLTSCVGVWLGHGRAKTVGDVTRLNAHPFEVRDDEGYISMFGAHNGTLNNKHEIEKELNGEKFGTDSEAFLNLIEKVGAKDAVAQARGAWALTWWEWEGNTINFLRNKERPLCYALSEDHKVLMWASEPWMLRIASDRNKVKLAENSENSPALYWIPEDTKLTWRIPTFKRGEEAEQSFGPHSKEGGLLGKPEEKRFPLTGNYGAANNQWYGRGVKWQGDDLDDEFDSIVGTGNRPVEKTNEKDTQEDKERSETEKGKPGPNQVVGFKGRLEDRATVEALKECGCDFCGDPIISNSFGWLDPNSLVCHRCMGGTHIKVDLNQGKILANVLSIVKGDK
jgi:predicted glutamine amidotransferase